MEAEVAQKVIESLPTVASTSGTLSALFSSVDDFFSTIVNWLDNHAWAGSSVGALVGFVLTRTYDFFSGRLLKLLGRPTLAEKYADIVRQHASEAAGHIAEKKRADALQEALLKSNSSHIEYIQTDLGVLMVRDGCRLGYLPGTEKGLRPLYKLNNSKKEETGR